MAQTQNQAAVPKVGRTEIDSVRSYMFEEIETKEVLHIDRLGADDVTRVIEKLAEMDVAGKQQIWVWIGGEDEVTLKLSDIWRVKIMRDGAVIIKVPDYALIADSNFLLLCADKDGRFAVTAKGREITWNGTEEYFDPADLYRLARDVARRILEQTRWI
ncbi:MAG: hypothetical protein RXR02_07970 [Thermoproteus sp.]